MRRYVTPKKASEILGVHPITLRRWENQGRVKAFKTQGGQRRYDMDEILGISGNEATVVTVGYARVSTHGQKDDLSRQIEFLRSTYPDAEIVSEVGSGLNFRRRKFLAILERVLSGDLKRLVIAYPDRLVRFGFELVEWICDRQKCELVVLNDRKLSPHNELVQDMLSIIHCFSSRLDGLRKYEKLLKEGVQKVPTEQVPETQTQRCQEDTGLSL